MSATGFERTHQCEKCPWRKDTDPSTIPGGYSAEMHRGLSSCDGGFSSRVMACHESPVGKEQACVGWMEWAIGPGNSIALRLRAIVGQIDPRKWLLLGEQYESLSAMLATAGKRKRVKAVCRR